MRRATKLRKVQPKTKQQPGEDLTVTIPLREWLEVKRQLVFCEDAMKTFLQKLAVVQAQVEQGPILKQTHRQSYFAAATRGPHAVPARTPTLDSSAQNPPGQSQTVETGKQLNAQRPALTYAEGIRGPVRELDKLQEQTASVPALNEERNSPDHMPAKTKKPSPHAGLDAPSFLEDCPQAKALTPEMGNKIVETKTSLK